MNATLKRLQSTFKHGLEQVEPPMLEEMEELVRLLKNYCEQEGQSISDARFTLLSNADDIELQLDSLRMGSLPEGLHSEVSQLWGQIERDWACQSTIDGLRDSLQKLVEPLHRSEEELQRIEQGVAIAAERVKTLTMLADLLDELVGRSIILPPA
jgi:chromosome segregation ATPase